MCGGVWEGLSSVYIWKCVGGAQWYVGCECEGLSSVYVWKCVGGAQWCVGCLCVCGWGSVVCIYAGVWEELGGVGVCICGSGEGR